MKTAIQILQSVKYYRKFKVLSTSDQHLIIDAMEEYAAQYRVLPCPCSQQENELQEINRINKATPK